MQEFIGNIEAVYGTQAAIDYFRGNTLRCLVEAKTSRDPISKLEEAVDYINQEIEYRASIPSLNRIINSVGRKLDEMPTEFVNDMMDELGKELVENLEEPIEASCLTCAHFEELPGAAPHCKKGMFPQKGTDACNLYSTYKDEQAED